MTLRQVILSITVIIFSEQTEITYENVKTQGNCPFLATLKKKID